MSIEEKLKKDGSVYTKADGRDPQKYDGVSRLEQINLFDSELDLNGIAPEKYDRQSKLVNSLPKSQLDLDGKVPSYNYKDNAPEGQAGRI